MINIIFGVFCCFLTVSAVPQNYYTTPVPILKQINRQNDDGSYSYGYEAADGTFKIETKYPTGEVYGKYGYVGDDGKIREVEYGASKRGFEPVGSDINVAPPTLSNSVDEANVDYDDGQYREDPAIYDKQVSSQGRAPLPNVAFKTSYQAPQTQYYQSSVNQVQPQVRYYNPQPRYQPVRISYDPSIFKGHPATNIDINTGSYTVSYTS